jgi:hypothetical protein
MRTMRSWSVVAIMIGLVAVPAWGRQAQTQPGAAQTQPSASPAPVPSAPAAAFDLSKSDEKAIAIVDKVIAAMGGDAWAKARFIKFTWTARRPDRKTSITHYWDRFSQRSRMEGPSKEGKPVVAIVDHQTRQGQATLDGQLLFDADAKKYVDIAYGRLINDAYWLFMQFKLKDPGVRLRYEGELKAGPVTYDKVLLSFDEGIGLTSKDKYWLFVNRATNLIERWSYVLEGQGANSSPVAWQWEDWQDIGGMKLSMRKTQPGGETDIVLEDVQVFETLPETVFTSTAPVNLTAAPEPPAGQ